LTRFGSWIEMCIFPSSVRERERERERESIGCSALAALQGLTW
jgi:hypothetical protein